MVFSIVGSCSVALAQEEDRVYLDGVLAATAKRTAQFYRVIEGRKDELFIGRTYTIDGRLKSEGTYADPELQLEHGPFTFYHANGSVESKGEYIMGNKTGVWERFDPSGSPLAEKVYDHAPLENIIYTRAETMPRHSQGNDKDLIRYIKARVAPSKGKRVNGSVTACFVVEKNGMLSDVKVINGKNVDVDQQVVDAIRSTSPWQPGIDKGKPVRVRMRVPVQF